MEAYELVDEERQESLLLLGLGHEQFEERLDGNLSKVRDRILGGEFERLNEAGVAMLEFLLVVPQDVLLLGDVGSVERLLTKVSTSSSIRQEIKKAYS